MRTIFKRRFFMLVCSIGFGSFFFYSCKCTKCLTTPPPLNAYAAALEARNHDIDSATAADWIQRYAVNKDSICHNMVGAFDSILPYSEAFNKKAMLDLLCLKNSIGLRMHYGMDTIFKVHIIVTGVNRKGDDLYYHGLAKENSMPCPTCP